MYKIAVLGDYDSIYGFAALGLDTFPVETQEEAAEMLSKLAAGDYGVIYITEACAAQLKHEISKISGADYSGDYPDSGNCRKYRSRSSGSKEIRRDSCRIRHSVR